jgi:hypothetical protein
MSDVRPLENYRFRSQLIEVGRVSPYASVTSQRIRSLLIRQKENQIRFSIGSHG